MHRNYSLKGNSGAQTERTAVDRFGIAVWEKSQENKKEAPEIRPRKAPKSEVYQKIYPPGEIYVIR